MSSTEIRDDLVIPKGTLIHVKGIPFELRDDTTVIGTQANLDGIDLDVDHIDATYLQASSQ